VTHCAKSWKVMGLRIDESLNSFIYLTFLTEMSTRNKKIKLLVSRVCPVPVFESDNRSAVCQLTVYTIWDPQHLTVI
jgi:hypothetical protein